MSVPRRLFVRLFLAVSGMVLLCVAVYLGLGWVVFTQQDWFRSNVGEGTFTHLWRAYAFTAGNLLPNDTDGDGICDGFEIFDRSDPRNPSDHQLLAFAAYPRTFKASGAGDGQPVWGNLMLVPGVRTSIQGSVICLGGEMSIGPEHFPASLRVRIVPPAGVAVASPGGRLANEPAEVAVGRDGELAFDVEIAADDAVDWSVRREVKIFNTTTGEQLGGSGMGYYVLVRAVRRFPAMDASAELLPGMDLESVTMLHDLVEDCVYVLRWPAPLAPADHVLIEGARDEDGAEWCPVHIYPREVTNCQLLAKPRSFPKASKFRAVPIVSPAAR